MDKIREYLPMAESFFVMLGVLFVAVQIRRQTIIARADHDRQKKQSTIEFYNLITSESYRFLDDIKGRRLDLSVVNADKQLRKSVIRYLSRFERLAVGVAADVYDFNILCVMSGRLIVQIYEQFRTYIEEARADKNTPMRYKEFELLAGKIARYRAEHPGQTVDKTIRVRRP